MTFIIIFAIISVFLAVNLLNDWAIRKVAAIVSVVLLIVWTVFCSVKIVKPGNARVLSTFGNIHPGYLGEGMHLILPFTEQDNFSTRRQILDYTGERTARTTSKNLVRLKIDVTVPYIINPVAAYKLHQRIHLKDADNLIGQNARRAIRDIGSAVDWEEALSEEGRSKFAKQIPAETKKLVVAELISAGVDSGLATRAFTFPEAVVRDILPMDKQIMESINAKEAASQDLLRQKTLTQIAEEIAKRRENDGVGIARMMDKLPKGYSIAEMRDLLYANAANTNAEAVMKMAEKDGTNMTVIVDGGSQGVGVAKSVR